MRHKRNVAQPTAPAPQPWLRLRTFGLILSLSVAVILLYAAHAREKSLREQLRLASLPAKQEETPPLLISGFGNQTCFDFLRSNAKNRPGTREALAMLNNGHFDVLRANCLIARDIPECAALKMDVVDEWYSKVAEKIRDGFAKAKLDPRGQADIAKFGEARFKITLAAHVLTDIQKISYVENKEVHPKLPWHMFCYGVTSEGRGTCLSMAIAWKIIGDKLGWPLGFRVARDHAYLTWHEGQVSLNIEPTYRGIPLTDEEYRHWLEIPDAELSSHFYMHDLSPAQMIAEFLDARASYFKAHKDFMRAFEDRLLSNDLSPCLDHGRALYFAWLNFAYDLEDRMLEKEVGAESAQWLRAENAKQQKLANARSTRSDVDAEMRRAQEMMSEVQAINAQNQAMIQGKLNAAGLPNVTFAPRIPGAAFAQPNINSLLPNRNPMGLGTGIGSGMGMPGPQYGPTFPSFPGEPSPNAAPMPNAGNTRVQPNMINEK